MGIGENISPLALEVDAHVAVTEALDDLAIRCGPTSPIKYVKLPRPPSGENPDMHLVRSLGHGA